VSVPPVPIITIIEPPTTPLPRLTVLALQSNVPVIEVAFVTVKSALVVPSHVVKLPAVIVRLLATVRGKIALPDNQERAFDALFTVRL
jgi:hypothetical protein